MAEKTLKKCTTSSAGASSLALSTTSTSSQEIGGKISTIFFDLDNTLIPTRSGDSKATLKKLADVLENQFAFCKEESSGATQSFLKSFRRCPDNSQTSLDSWRTYLWREALPKRFKHLAEQIYPKWLELRYRYLALPNDYVKMLRQFREAGFLLALITNGPSNAQWEKINKLNVSQHFDCVLVSSDLPWEKPNPHIFHAACNFLGVKPTECIMIGDKLETDIKGGRLANLGATFWLPLSNDEIDLTDVSHPPDIILRTLMDLYKYFPQLNSATVPSSSSSSSSSSSLLLSSSSNAVTTIPLSFTATTQMAATTSSLYGTASCSQTQRRRGSHISGNSNASTCDSDIQSHKLQQQQKQQQHHNNNINNRNNKYRRGGSLPAIEYINSETENSSDSIFS